MMSGGTVVPSLPRINGDGIKSDGEMYGYKQKNGRRLKRSKSNNGSLSKTNSERSQKLTSEFGTLAIRHGYNPDKWKSMNALTVPISLGTTYKMPSPGEPKGHMYTRLGNPTRDVLEKKLASLEQAKYCRVFSSGMSTAVVLDSMLKPGDHVVLSDFLYPGMREYFTNVAVNRHGRQVTLVDMTSQTALKKALRPETKMVWFETPSNPQLHIIDIARVVQKAKQANAEVLVVVDNTMMSPFFQNPLTLGADVVVHSVTKYINGHSDVLMGALMTNLEKVDKEAGYMQIVTGAVPSPFDCYMTYRGVKSLHLRMRAHMENAMAVAKFLESNPRVEHVIFPELESHPHHKLHKKQSTGVSGMVAFYLRGGMRESKVFMKSLRVFTCAVSLGGLASLADLTTCMTGMLLSAEDKARTGVTDNFIRLSVGCEDMQDLIRDLDQALNAAIPSTPSSGFSSGRSSLG